MIESAIQVFVRSRPTSHFAHDAIRVDRDTVRIHFDRLASSTGTLNNLQQDWSFAFAQVLHNESQEAVFNACARDMVVSALDGYNGTLMAYGQTGAGKTFTMWNATSEYQQRGITPRSVSLLFRSIADRAGKSAAQITVGISYLEIYNETLRDLLADGDSESRDLSVRELGNGNVSIPGLTKALATTEEQALNLLFEGDANRAMAQHANNRTSSRSHTIFTIHVESHSRVENGSQIVASKLNLVDLAGSERVAKTDSRGQTLQEALYINRSLSFLEQVVLALSDKTRDHIPFRSSKLTHVLRDSLGGNSVTRLIANIWPEAKHLEETISTLKFATRMMRLTTSAIVNVQPDTNVLLKQYEREIVQLKKRLAKRDLNMDFTPDPTAVDAPDPDGDDLRAQIEQYVAGDIEGLEITNMRQLENAMRQFKHLILESRQNNEATAPAGQHTAESKTATTEKVAEKHNPHSEADQSDAALSDVKTDVDDDLETTRQPDANRGEVANSTGITPSAAFNSGSPQANDDETFTEWCNRDGAELSNEYSQAINRSRDIRAHLRLASAKVNAAKQKIEQLSSRLNSMRASKKSIDDYDSKDSKIVIDEEEFVAMRELSQRKAEYMAAFKDWERSKTEASEAKEQIQRMKSQMAHEFLQWCEKRQSAARIDVLDDGERFDKLETERILNTEPESLPYYNARKALLQKEAKKRAIRRTVAK